MLPIVWQSLASEGFDCFAGSVRCGPVSNLLVVLYLGAAQACGAGAEHASARRKRRFKMP